MGSPVNPKGYTSKYLDVDFTPKYPFGFGLSYTKFEYSGLRVSGSPVHLGATFTVSAEVANTGTYEADEIVQLYVRDLVGSVTRPVRELKVFQRATSGKARNRRYSSPWARMTLRYTGKGISL